MKTTPTLAPYLAYFFAIALLASSCTSATMIQSTPPGAKVYLDGQPVGTTPYRMADTKIVGTCTMVDLELEGYEPIYTQICRNEEVDAGAIVGGIFFLFPFLWTMKYYPTHHYEFREAGGAAPMPAVAPDSQEAPLTPSKAEELRELKKLLDEGVLTQEEFDREKARILNRDN
jgi:hypothetical protein